MAMPGGLGTFFSGRDGSQSYSRYAIKSQHDVAVKRIGIRRRKHRESTART
jgi:hypothetical protein